jgi:hypothetical protein
MIRSRVVAELMLEYQVKAQRIDAHGSMAETKYASITLDTDLAGRGTPSIRPSCCSLLSLPA